MDENSGEKGKLYHLGIEREKRKIDSKINKAEELINTLKKENEELEALRDKNKPELIEDLIKMRKTIIQYLTDGEIDANKAKEMLEKINEAERGIKNN